MLFYLEGINMKETRGAKYGRNLALWIDYTIENLPEEKKKDYKVRLVKELKNYSFEPRKKGTPKNSGCVRELEGIVDVDIEEPEELAKLVKEGIHLMYQKFTAKRVFDSLLKYLD